MWEHVPRYNNSFVFLSEYVLFGRQGKLFTAQQKGVDFLVWIPTEGMEMLLSQRLCLFNLHMAIHLHNPLPTL